MLEEGGLGMGVGETKRKGEKKQACPSLHSFLFSSILLTHSTVFAGLYTSFIIAVRIYNTPPYASIREGPGLGPARNGYMPGRICT